MNLICGEKIAIVTDKPQTTRDRIIGIKTTSDAQVIFLDTPGLHESGKALNKRMMQAARAAASEADMILLLCDPTVDSLKEEVEWMEKMGQLGKPMLLAINKIDAIPKENLLPVMKVWADAGISDIHLISARTGDGVDALEREIIARLPEGPPLYPADTLTEHTERFLASEIIREKLFFFTHQEIPYSAMVRIEEFKERSANLSVVRAVIYVEKESQKGIIIGRGGEMIKRIGQAARQEMEYRFGRKFFLDLSVKTKKDWSKNEAFLKSLEREMQR